MSVPLDSAIGGATHTATVLASTVAIPTPTLDITGGGSAITSVAVVTATVTVPAPAITGGANLNANPVAVDIATRAVTTIPALLVARAIHAGKRRARTARTSERPSST